MTMDKEEKEIMESIMRQHDALPKHMREFAHYWYSEWWAESIRNRWAGTGLEDIQGKPI